MYLKHCTYPLWDLSTYDILRSYLLVCQIQNGKTITKALILYHMGASITDPGDCVLPQEDLNIY